MTDVLLNSEYGSEQLVLNLKVFLWELQKLGFVNCRQNFFQELIYKAFGGTLKNKYPANVEK